DDQETDFDEEFAAVEPIYGGIFQGGVREEAVPEEGGGGDVDREVERFPKAAAEARAQVRSDHDDGDDIERDGAERVFERLAGGVHGVKEVDEAELCGLVEKKNDGRKAGKRGGAM